MERPQHTSRLPLLLCVALIVLLSAELLGPIWPV
jgi:hypothetical protein